MVVVEKELHWLVYILLQEGRTPLSSHHHLPLFLQVVGYFVVYILWVILP